jgi:hypothetical protein
VICGYELCVGNLCAPAEHIWCDIQLQCCNEACQRVGLELEIVRRPNRPAGLNCGLPDAGAVVDYDLPVSRQRAQQPRRPVRHGARYAYNHYL